MSPVRNSDNSCSMTFYSNRAKVYVQDDSSLTRPLGKRHTIILTGLDAEDLRAIRDQATDLLKMYDA